MSGLRSIRSLLEALAGFGGALGVWFGGQRLDITDDMRFIGALAVLLLGLASARFRSLADDDTPTGESGRKMGPAIKENIEKLMRKRLKDLRRILRRRGRYALPWFLVLGGEGAGKTTLLNHSGVEPLVWPARNEATRLMEPLVSRQGVFLDTAGSFVAEPDLPPALARCWGMLVEDLVRLRPLLPVNGVIITLSAAELSQADLHHRQSLAQGIRQRLHSVQEKLGSSLPVYVLISKMDQLPGFMEFFSHVDAEERDQPWGFTFDADEPSLESRAPLDGFSTAFDRLVAVLAERQLGLLHQERNQSRAGRIAGFPARVAGLKAALESVLNIVFAPSDLPMPSQPRALFLTSSLQDGMIVDPLQADLSRRFGLRRPPLNVSFAGAAGSESQSWFITRPVQETILAEAGLICYRHDPYGHRVVMRRLAAAAVVLACLIGGMMLSGRYQDDLRALEEISLQIDQRRLVASFELAPQLRTLEFLVEVDHLRPPPLGPSRFLDDLDHAAALSKARQFVEEQLIDHAIMPRLVAQLRQRMGEKDIPRGELADDLALARMLAEETPADSGMLTVWLDDSVLHLLPEAISNHAAMRQLVVERTAMHLLGGHGAHHLIDQDMLRDGEERLGGMR